MPAHMGTDALPFHLSAHGITAIHVYSHIKDVRCTHYAHFFFFFFCKCPTTPHLPPSLVDSLIFYLYLYTVMKQ